MRPYRIIFPDKTHTMKTPFRLLIVLLTILSLFCVSCSSESGSGSKAGKTSSSKKEPPKKKKKKKTVEVVQPVPEEPKVPPKPPLPTDLSSWTKADFLRAREEGNSKLDEACLLLGKPFAGKPTAANAVDILHSVLAPLPIPEMNVIPKPVFNEDTEPSDRRRIEEEYKRKVREEEERVKNIPELNSRTIAAFIEILGQNGDTSAWKLLLDMLQRRFTVDDDSDIDEPIVKTILKYPRSNNINIIFLMITQPESLLQTTLPVSEDNKKRRISPSQIRKLALGWMEKNSYPDFREQVTDYIIAHPENEELKNLAIPLLVTNKAGNIRCMKKLYLTGGLLTPQDQSSLERYFLECSAAAFASITNQATLGGRMSAQELSSVVPAEKTPDPASGEAEKPENASDAANQASSQENFPAPQSETSQTPNMAESSTPYEPYQDCTLGTIDALKIMALHPEYALQILEVVWSDDFINQQYAIWDARREFRDKERDANARFLLALPLEGKREYWRDFFDSIYQDGPANLQRSPLVGYSPLDPGILLELKRLKRNTLPPSVRKNTNNKSRGAAARERQIAFQGSWMEMVRQAVKFQMERCYSASAVQKTLRINDPKIKARTPWKVPEDAKILCEYHMILSQGDVKDIPNIAIAPYEIHYMQIQWKGRAILIPQMFKYNDEGVPRIRYRGPRSSDKEYVWFEYNKSDYSQSLDIRVQLKSEDLKSEVEAPIQIMSIRVRSEQE